MGTVVMHQDRLTPLYMHSLTHKDNEKAYCHHVQLNFQRCLLVWPISAWYLPHLKITTLQVISTIGLTIHATDPEPTGFERFAVCAQ